MRPQPSRPRRSRRSTSAWTRAWRQFATRRLEEPFPYLILDARYDAPYQAIIRTAENQRCDVIVMASHGRGGVSAFLLGSETMKVLSHSKIPVLVVR